MAGLDNIMGALKGGAQSVGEGVGAAGNGGITNILFQVGIALTLIAVIVIPLIIWYLYFFNVRYKALVKYDTQNGLRHFFDKIIEKKMKNGDTYFKLLGKKELCCYIDPKSVTHGKSGMFSYKPLVELYRDSEGNYHLTDFITNAPLYDVDGNIIRRVPLVKPNPTKNMKEIYSKFIKSTYEKYKDIDVWLKYAPAFILTASILGMIMIIVATKIS